MPIYVKLMAEMWTWRSNNTRQVTRSETRLKTVWKRTIWLRAVCNTADHEPHYRWLLWQMTYILGLGTSTSLTGSSSSYEPIYQATVQSLQDANLVSLKVKITKLELQKTLQRDTKTEHMLY